MDTAFGQAFRDHAADIPSLGSNIHYSKSADRLRRLVREGPLKLTDIRDNPEHFFYAHDVLSGFSTQVGPGFGIRFTVQVNLFSGTILALGNPEQVAMLDTIQKEGRLGCFCLTERLAGVNSGLVVDTTCVWDEEKQMFCLDCPGEGSKKNWISQGLTADMAVVVAQLVVKGKSHGPHAFLMDFRKGGELVPGVTAEDMGDKTIGNDLDNARITFSKVWLPKTAILDRYSGIENGEYLQRQAGVSNMDMIGQRLYTGRQVIAASALIFARQLFKGARAYADNKKCWLPKGSMMLSEVPQIADVLAEADQALRRVEKFQKSCETRICECLKSGKVPDNNLVESIACLKVKAIESSIEWCFKLKQELGSFALMGGSGFEKMDYLQCCKFAEGDSRILMQKIARDRLTAFSKNMQGTEVEAKICTELGTAMMSSSDKMVTWNQNWKLVYDLARAVIERMVDSEEPSAKL